MSREYNFEYHLYYDSRSLTSRVIASGIRNYFKLKQYLRERDFDLLLGKLKFLIRKQSSDTTTTSSNSGFEYVDSGTPYHEKELENIDIYDKKNHLLKTIVFDFLYLSTEESKDIKLYKVLNTPNSYLINGKNSKQEFMIK